MTAYSTKYFPFCPRKKKCPLSSENKIKKIKIKNERCMGWNLHVKKYVICCLNKKKLKHRIKGGGLMLLLRIGKADGKRMYGGNHWLTVSWCRFFRIYFCIEGVQYVSDWSTRKFIFMIYTKYISKIFHRYLRMFSNSTWLFSDAHSRSHF